MPSTPAVRVAVIGLVALLSAATQIALAPPATASPRIEASPATGLDPAGHRVTVRGSGYDEFKGIYVAWCVVPPAGQKPTPCGGGEDRDGKSGNSVWVSSNPPMYGLGLAEPYDGNGGFEVEIVVSRYIEAEDGRIDCFVTACAVTTRNDHERSSDRSQDAYASVAFVGQESAAATPPAPSSETDERTGRSASSSPTPATSPEGDVPAEETDGPRGSERASATATAAPTSPAPATPPKPSPSVPSRALSTPRLDGETRSRPSVRETERGTALAVAASAAEPTRRPRLPLVLAALAVVGSGLTVARVLRVQP